MEYKAGDLIGSKYKVVDLIGGGAMGVVYKADQINIKKTVAIKILHREFAQSKEFRERFLREARSAASLVHSNICTVTDFDVTDDGDYYLVMEFLNGESLRRRMDRVGTMTPYCALCIMRQLMCALDCAHQNNVIHRDIKPDNIFLISRDGRNDFVKLIDFGIAHIETTMEDMRALTRAGHVYGTPRYISPEQAEGKPIDGRSDLYAAGIILYEMIMGEPLFDAPHYVELLHKQINEPAPHLPKNLDYSDALDGILQKLLAKKPEDRFSSAMEVVPLLDEIIMRVSIETPADMKYVSLPHLPAENTMSNSKDKKTLSQKIANDMPKNSTQWKLLVVLAIAFAIIIVVIVSFISNKAEEAYDGMVQSIKNETLQAHGIDPSASPTPAPTPQQQAVPAPESAPAAPAQGNIKPAPFNTNELDFIYDFDPSLKAEATMEQIATDYHSGRFDAALSGMNALRTRHWFNPNFVRLYMLVTKKAGNRTESIKTLGRICNIEPLAAHHPEVRVALYEFFSDPETVESFKVLIPLDGLMATNFAHLVMWSDYDKEEERLRRIISLFDASNKSNVPEYLLDGVDMYRIPKEDCEARRKLVVKYVSRHSAQLRQFAAMTPIFRSKEKRCSNGRSMVDCNACMRDYLDTQTANFENR